MLNSNDILRTIKQAACQAVEESDPTRLMYGTITGVDEKTGRILGVKIDQDLEFDEDQAELMIDTPSEYKERKMLIKHPLFAEIRKLFEEINTSEKCREVFSGTYELCRDDGCAEDEISVTIKDFLKVGDSVIITQAQGGQKFTISGRLGNDSDN